jgi:hypothetical protein
MFTPLGKNNGPWINHSPQFYPNGKTDRLFYFPIFVGPQIFPNCPFVWEIRRTYLGSIIVRRFTRLQGVHFPLVKGNLRDLWILVFVRKFFARKTYERTYITVCHTSKPMKKTFFKVNPRLHIKLPKNLFSEFLFVKKYCLYFAEIFICRNIYLRNFHLRNVLLFWKNACFSQELGT